jgi:hypothetical protein
MLHASVHGVDILLPALYGLRFRIASVELCGWGNCHFHQRLGAPSAAKLGLKHKAALSVACDAGSGRRIEETATSSGARTPKCATQRPVRNHPLTRHITDIPGSDAIDPFVWSGRASQEGLVEVAVSGLASMYGPAVHRKRVWSRWR